MTCAEPEISTAALREGSFGICFRTVSSARCILDVMRTCISCGDPIDSRRKDATFCAKSKCRAADYRKRKKEAAEAQAAAHVHHASAHLSCPCGRSFLLQVKSQDFGEGSASLTVTPIPAAGESVTQTVSPPNILRKETVSPTAAPQLPTPENCSEHILGGVTAVSAGTESAAGVVAASTEQRALVFQPAKDAIPTSSLPDLQPPLQTIELYFTDSVGRLIRFWDAVRTIGKYGWRVRDSAKAALGASRQQGTGLGGTPGRWQEFYPSQSPAAFEYDADLAVLCWDEAKARAYAAEPELLEAALGVNWLLVLRRWRDENMRGRSK
jgi:hypothetical protein